MHNAGDTQWRLAHQPSFDGLRAVAVLAVFAFHLGVTPGGWLGVEAFFVLSGFLITTLLLQERLVTGTLEVGRFYLRRGVRLLPALVVVLAGLTAFSLITDRERSLVLKGDVVSLLYVANWASMSESLGPLGHIWSLSIEEQFYWVWPILLVVVLAVTTSSLRAVLRITVALILAGLAWRMYLAASGGDWFPQVYYSLQTRGPGILIGSAAATWLLLRNGRIPRALQKSRTPVALFAAMGLAMVFVPDHNPLTWILGVAAFDLIVIALIVCMINATHLVARLLELAPMQYMGRISYSFYLWQMPVIWAVAGLGLATPARMGLQLTLPFALAALSFRFVEDPARRVMRRFTHQQPLAVRTPTV